MDRGSWHCTGGRDQDHPKKKKWKCQNGWGGLTNSYVRVVKGKEKKERYTQLNIEFQRLARRDKKTFLSDQCKEIRGKQQNGKDEISSRKLEILREHFMQRWAQ